MGRRNAMLALVVRSAGPGSVLPVDSWEV